MGITKSIGIALDRFSPSIGTKLRRVWYKLNGRATADFRFRVEEKLIRTEDNITRTADDILRQARRTEDSLQRSSKVVEWRFQDLKQFIDTSPKNSDLSFVLQDSLDRLKKLSYSSRSDFAVVSVLPPAQTGIANFTLKAFAAADVPVDIYFPHLNVSSYLIATHRLAADHPSLSFFGMEALEAGLALRGYKAVIWVLGNSDDHIEVAKMLRMARYLPPTTPMWIEIHDPVALNLLSKVARAERSDFVNILKQSSAVNLEGVNWDEVRRGHYTEIAERGATGLPALLNDVPFEGLLFHSRAARDLVFRDWPKLNPALAHVLFHPVFEPFKSSQPKTREHGMRIGSFGLPGEAKGTMTVIEAFRLIRQHSPDATLLLAGYKVAHYLQHHKLLDEPGLIFEDSPTTERLMELMGSVDIAVQLRKRNTGESSGVVPQLLSLDRPIIASAVGALAEHGDAVRYVDADCSSQDLANVILDESRNFGRRGQMREEYVTAHTPRRFCQDLMKVMGLEAPAYLSKSKTAESKTAGTAYQGATFGSSWDDTDPSPSTWSQFERIMRDMGLAENAYIQSHIRRYRHTLAAIEEISPKAGGAALEVGTSWLFAIIMRSQLGFERVDVTDFKLGDDRKVIPNNLNYPCFEGEFQAFNINLEGEELPTESEQYDLVLCCEVLEHMDVDPMFMLSELNRVMRTGGKLLLTTPNVTSSRNVKKILEGYAPHFFMQYFSDRSPYRHNIEYAPNQVKALLTAAGFNIDRWWAADTFEEPSIDTLNLLHRLGFPTDNRGDNLFFVATKETSVRNRYPLEVYTRVDSVR